MLFNSVAFILFFICITIMYYAVIPKGYQYVLLVVASYYFYMCWNAKYALLMATSTLITYLSGLGIEYFSCKYAESARRQLRCKKLIVFGSFAINLGILAFFKYGGFILDNINFITRQDLHMPFDILLPVGISFYTFQALSYTVDVYRGGIGQRKISSIMHCLCRFFHNWLPGLLSAAIIC